MSTGLALATVLGLMVAGPIALMRVPTHLQLTVTDTALVIEPQGLDSWWAGTGRSRCRSGDRLDPNRAAVGGTGRAAQARLRPGALRSTG